MTIISRRKYIELIVIKCSITHQSVVTSRSNYCLLGRYNNCFYQMQSINLALFHSSIFFSKFLEAINYARYQNRFSEVFNRLGKLGQKIHGKTYSISPLSYKTLTLVVSNQKLSTHTNVSYRNSGYFFP